MNNRNGIWRKLGVVLTVAVFVVGVVVFVVRADSTARAAQERVEDHETRLRVTEKDLSEIRSDIRLIRVIMQRREKENPSEASADRGGVLRPAGRLPRR